MLAVRLSRGSLSVAAVAVSVSLLGAVSSFVGLSSLPHFGIDDANITHVYARNIAEGLGYVYRPGGERVEGSTSALWTAINALVWRIDHEPRVALLVICGALSMATVYIALDLVGDLSRLFGVCRRWSLASACILLASAPAFFAWTVWSLMDVALWSFFVVLSASACFRFLAFPQNTTASMAVLVFAVAGLVITRPEGVVLALGLLGTTAFAAAFEPRISRPSIFRVLGLASFGALICFAGLTAARLRYFGVPLPNTFYAKVSLDPVETLYLGLRYAFGSLFKMEFLAVGLLAWAGLVALHWWRVSSGPREHSGLRLVLAPILASIIGMFGIAILVGGDHFNGERFMQPIWPLVASGLAVAVAVVGTRAFAGVPLHRRYAALLATVVGVFVFGLNGLSFFGTPYSMKYEFWLSNTGREVGEGLNEIAARNAPLSVGVIAAGGVALTYRGQIYDLMGLNWPAMARSSSTKAGGRGHASFDADVFYAALPDAVIPRFLSDQDSWIVTPFVSSALKGILTTDRFRSIYVPARIAVRRGTLGVFVSRPWLARSDPDGIDVLEWRDVTFAPPEPQEGL